MRFTRKTALTAVAVASIGITGVSTVPTAGALPTTVQRASSAPASADHVIVGFRSGVSTTEHDRVLRDHKVRSHRRVTAAVSSAQTELIQLPAGASVDTEIAALKADPAVRFAEPDYQVTEQATSDDPFFTSGQLWGMAGDASTPANQYGTGAAEAWSAGYTGSSNVVVGVIDEGIQITHPELAANIWVNPWEIAGDGIDNDGNGYIDDVNGWDFFNNDKTVFDGTATAGLDAHGTHVSGTIGGTGGNGQGVAGINWSVKIISTKFLGPAGGSISAAIAALNYLVDMKVRHGVNIVAVNNSWGGGGFSQAMSDAINLAGDHGILFIAAAGNSGTNNDTTANYPSNYDCTKGGTRGWDCVVAVAAIDSAGALASFSQYGATTVDLGAPGVDIISSVPTNSYASYAGTSMATPHVTGAVALCASINPNLDAAGIRSAIIASATPTSSLTGKTVTGGRLDVGAMAARCAVSSAAVAGAPSALTATATNESTISLSWTDGVTAETRYDIERAPSVSGVCGTYVVIGQGPANTAAYTVSNLTAATTYCFRVRAANYFGGGTTSAYSTTASATTLAAPQPYSCAASSYSWIDATTGGTSYVIGDDASATVGLPFNFSFYGTSYNSVQVASNGYLRLGAGAATAFANVTIPNAADPNAIIAPWWDDLSPNLGGTIWTTTTGTAPNRKFVASWVGVPHFGGGTTNVTFEAILDEATGDITLQYLDATTTSTASNKGVGATVGLENSTGTAGTLISYNTASLSDLSARRCSNTATLVAPTVSTTTLAAGLVGSAYSATLAATSGTAPYTWSLVSGTLPAGLSLNTSTGAITGAPTTAGTSSITVQAADTKGLVGTKALSIAVTAPAVLAISTTSLAGGTVGTAYSVTLAAAGGTKPYTWSISTGTLPAGLTLNSSTGAITGTPTTSGASSITVRVTDAAARTITKALSINVVLPAIPGAFNKSAPATNATARSRTALALSWAAATGAVSYRYCVDTVNDSVCNTSWVNVGTARTVTIGALGSLTAYYWQVEAVNLGGSRAANTGTWWKFTTAV